MFSSLLNLYPPLQVQPLCPQRPETFCEPYYYIYNFVVDEEFDGSLFLFEFSALHIMAWT